MTLALGIHVGHHSAVALADDGNVLAAVQQERITRRKHDGNEVLGNDLPVLECLRATGCELRDVRTIVTSFQAASPGGLGLHRPLWSPDFRLFDPFESRHQVLSHHLAHAFSSTIASGFHTAAVLVVDLAGSSTIDGRDYAVPFAQWYESLTNVADQSQVMTECLSIYRWNAGVCELVDRDFCVPHNAPESFVFSPASLYDNVSAFVFRRPNAHGQLMALGAYALQAAHQPLKADDIVRIGPDGSVVFRNDWQHRLKWGQTERDHAETALAVQQAFEKAMLAHVRRAHRLVGGACLAGAGGAFLNILSNSRISSEGPFESFFVPSAPHDAGVAIGCALWGSISAQPLGARRSATPRGTPNSSSDRFGPPHSSSEVQAAIVQAGSGIVTESVTLREQLAELLHDGAIILRYRGRSEFGPRALGGRSLLGSPLLANTKDRLNKIKGRQPWRPVAPVVQSSRVGDFFCGPAISPFMSFAHQVRGEHRDQLRALWHPDATTRAQTLSETDDPELHALLESFGELTSYPILVNTSANGRGQPIVETPQNAMALYLCSPDIDVLLLDDVIVSRSDLGDMRSLVPVVDLAPGCVLTLIATGVSRYALATKGRASVQISLELYSVLSGLASGGSLRADLLSHLSMPAKAELKQLAVEGILLLGDGMQ